MTTHTQLTPGRPVTTPAAGHYIRRDHTVIGTADQIANLINHHRDAGTLIAATTPCPLTGGRFQTTIWVREPVPARPTLRATSLAEQSRTGNRRPQRRTRSPTCQLPLVASKRPGSRVANLSPMWRCPASSGCSRSGMGSDSQSVSP